MMPVDNTPPNGGIALPVGSTVQFALSKANSLDSTIHSTQRSYTMKDTIKTLAIAGLLAASAGAQAEILGSKPNQAGGEILWTSATCGSKNDGWQVYSTMDGGLVSHGGCAFDLGDHRVGIRWDDGDFSVMPNEWLLTTAGKRAVAAARAQAKAPGSSFSDRLLGPGWTPPAPPTKTVKYRM
jgi:hypothetical protein